LFATLEVSEMTTTPTSAPTPAPTGPQGPPRELLLSSTFLLKRLGWMITDRAHDALEPTGLTSQHYAVLSLLDEGVRETQGEIADTLNYDRSHLVGLLDELEEKGYVVRRRDQADRRRQLVSLTPAGKDTLTGLRTILKKVEKEFLAPLDAEQRELLHALLLDLTAHHDPRCASARQ
jgi:DNA-binding MarR family transcriptional regulator